MAVKRKNSMKERLMANFGNMTGPEPEEEVVDISEDEDEKRMNALRQEEERLSEILEQKDSAGTGLTANGEASDAATTTPEIQEPEPVQPIQDVSVSVQTEQTPMDSTASASGNTDVMEEGRVGGALTDLGPNHRLTTIIPEKMVTYLRIRAASEGVFKAQISYMLMKLIKDDMENHKDLTNF